MAKPAPPQAYRPCPGCRTPVLYASDEPFDVHRPACASHEGVYWVVLNGDNVTFRAVPVRGATGGYQRHRCQEAV